MKQYGYSTTNDLKIHLLFYEICKGDYPLPSLEKEVCLYQVFDV